MKTQIEREREDLKKTFLEVREEIEPANLLKKAVGGVFDFSKNNASGEKSGILAGLPAPVNFLANLFIKDPKWAFLIKLVVPVALKFLPKMGKTKAESAAAESIEKVPKVPVKAKIYGQFRRGVSSLRGLLKKSKKKNEPEKVVGEDANGIELTEN